MRRDHNHQEGVMNVEQDVEQDSHNSATRAWSLLHMVRAVGPGTLDELAGPKYQKGDLANHQKGDLANTRCLLEDVFKRWAKVVREHLDTEHLHTDPKDVPHRASSHRASSHRAPADVPRAKGKGKANTKAKAKAKGNEYQHVDTDEEAFGPYAREYSDFSDDYDYDSDGDLSAYTGPMFVKISLPRNAG
jgi:hypothetical protein